MSETSDFRNAVRRAVADYMKSEGCSCCRDIDAHEKHAAALARLLKVPMYDDGSGWDFSIFASPVPAEGEKP